MTDHCALCVLSKKTPHSPRLRRWQLILSEYDYEVCYRKGSLQCDVDCLSRQPVDDVDVYTERCLIVKPLQDWQGLYDSDDQFVSLRARVDERESEFKLIDGLLYKGNRLYVPKEKRSEVLRDAHDSVISLHEGVAGTSYRLKDFWWPNLDDDVKEYISQCQACQLRKTERQKPSGQMQSHESFEPWHKISFDYLGPLAATESNKRFVVVAIDNFTRFVDAKALKDQSASRFAKYFTNLICRFGIPKVIVTDNAKTFDNKLVKEVCNLFQIEHQMAAPHHSRGNSVTERVIQTVQEKLSLITNHVCSSLSWDSALPNVILSINSKYHKATGFSPFELLFGRQPPVIQQSFAAKITCYDLHAKAIKASMQVMHARAIASDNDAKAKAKVRFDAARRPLNFDLGDLVLSRVRDRSSKLSDKFEGPYRVVAKDKDIYT